MAKFNRANLSLRLLSALVMAPLVLLAVYLGGWVYVLAVALAVALGLREWLSLTRPSYILSLLGIPYLGGFGLAMFYLRAIPDNGAALVYYLLAVVWGTDIGAYVAGRTIGGPKLAPVISPNKTWSGLFGGMALAVAFGYGAAIGLDARKPSVALFLAILLAGIAQAGDLFKSYFKRRAGVKDSGQLIPGHGGMLDRIDGLIFAAIFLALLEALAGTTFRWW